MTAIFNIIYHFIYVAKEFSCISFYKTNDRFLQLPDRQLLNLLSFISVLIKFHMQVDSAKLSHNGLRFGQLSCHVIKIYGGPQLKWSTELYFIHDNILGNIYER